MIGLHLDLGKIRAYGSAYLASILYQNEYGDFVYTLDSSSNMILDNQSMGGEANDGILYSGRGIELGATNDVDIPIHHTLGAEEGTNGYTNNSLDEISTLTLATANGYTLDITTAGTDASYPRPYCEDANGVYSIGDIILCSFDLEVISGSVEIQSFNDRLNNIMKTPADTYSITTSGHHEMYGTIVADGQFTRIEFRHNGTLVGKCTISNVSFKQITNPNSYLTYYDFTDGLVTLGNSVDGGSSKEYITNGGFDGNADGWNLTGTAYYLNGVVGINSPLGEAADIQQASGLTAGRTYLVTMTANIASGQVLFNMGANIEITHGTNTYVVTANDTFFKFKRGAGSVIATFDNISVKEILPISTKYTLNTKTVNNFITHTTPWSALDWTKINNNPNLIGKLALETLGATKTIPDLDMVMDAGASADSYYMCSEKSGAYLVDSRVAYGAEMVGTPTAYGANTLVDNLNGTYTLTVIDEPHGCFFSPLTHSTGSIYLANVNIISASVVSTLNKFAIWDGGTTHLTNINIGNNILFYKSIGNLGDCRFNSLAIGDVVTFSWSIKEISAREIANYAETVRTNADLQQKGLQQTAFVTDGAGVPTAYSSNLLQFNGDGRYVDTGFIHGANPFIVELGIPTVISSGTNQQNGGGTATLTEKLQVGITLSDQARVDLLGITYTTVSAVTSLFASLVYDGTTGYIYIDGSLVASSVVSPTSSVFPFYIGVRNQDGTLLFPMYSPIDHFKIITSASQIANYDALAAYNDYLA